jgi:hypothetical protein
MGTGLVRALELSPTWPESLSPQAQGVFEREHEEETRVNKANHPTRSTALANLIGNSFPW